MVKWAIYPLPVATGGGVLSWIARTMDGSRAGPKHVPYPSPEEAIEAADLWFAARDARETETRAGRIIAACETGRYFIRPRNVQSTDTQGNPITIKVFSGFAINGNPTAVVDRPSFTQAVIAMEALLP